MSEYMQEEQGAGLDDGGDYSGSEGDYSGLGGYEDFEPVGDPGLQDDFADVRETLEAYGIDPDRFDEYLSAQTGAAIAPVAEGVDAWQSQQAIEAKTGELLDWMGKEFEQAGVPEDRFDEGAEAVLELGAELFGQERDRILRDFEQTLNEGGVTAEQITQITPEQAAEILALVDATAAIDATVRALSEWIRSLDPAAAVPKNYSVTNRITRDGPLPSTVQAFREAGWAPEQIAPRSVGEAVAMTRNDYRGDKRSVAQRMFGGQA
jgi:hypothetical protein